MTKTAEEKNIFNCHKTLLKNAQHSTVKCMKVSCITVHNITVLNTV